MKTIDEKIILASLLKDGEIFTKIFPFLEEKYFSEKWSRIVFQLIRRHYEKYNSIIPDHALELKIDQLKSINESVYNQLIEFHAYFREYENVEKEFIIDEIETWIKSRIYYLALMDAIEKYERDELDGNLVDKVNSAFSFSFDTDVGLDFENIEEKWQRYTDVKRKVPFILKSLQDRTNNGVNTKTLNVLVSSESGAGKTLVMCHLAADYIKLGYNVLYVTMEIAEEEITGRIDSNVLDIPLNKINRISKEEYLKAFEHNRVKGRLYVKEYPTGTPHAGHFRYLLKELELKQHFKPDILFCDYLNITNSIAKNKPGDTYNRLKAVSEELRSLSQEYDMVIWSATQGNRSSVANLNMGQENTSESMSIVYTTDLMLGLITTEEFTQQGVLLFSVLKNRYAKEKDKFFLKVDKEHMRLMETDVISDEYNLKKDENKVYVPTNTLGNKKKELDKKGIDWS